MLQVNTLKNDRLFRHICMKLNFLQTFMQISSHPIKKNTKDSKRLIRTFSHWPSMANLIALVVSYRTSQLLIINSESLINHGHSLINSNAILGSKAT